MRAFASRRFVAGSARMLQVPFLAGYAPTYGSLADPPGGSVIVAAVNWLQGTLLGTAATTIAVIAIAWVGLMLMTGRVSVRYGFTVFLGCFILFGAALISAGIRGSLDGTPVAYAPPPPPPPPIQPPPPPRPANPDPYAGAAVPSR
ncbi:MAG TPA: TrbC/VirB2 family protein [Allosphingosinicella sp.]|nr:TrbC/VirB2 family protein [Allosphingosinicella sp.]